LGPATLQGDKVSAIHIETVQMADEIPDDTIARTVAGPASSTDAAFASDDPMKPISIAVNFAGEKVLFNFSTDASVEDLIIACDERWGSDYDWSASKMIPDRTPGVKPLLKPKTDLAISIAPLSGKSVKVIASKVKDITQLHESERQALKHWARRREAQKHARKATATPRNPEDATYTFLQVRPLPNMPHPERSLAFLKKLMLDPGIRHVMRKHKFTVGLLTEMDPAAYTESTHEGVTRILGLNRNGGEVIELRLRTDAGDGYRAYGVIRKTLCHELAHNVHGPHDSKFWDLCHQIEREVQAADYTSSGRTVGDQEYYHPSEGLEGGDNDEEHAFDHGGWTGGTYVLGGNGNAGGSGSQGSAGPQGIPQREIMLQAAERRRQLLRDAQKKSEPSQEDSDAEKKP
jgi:hypothetical protein